MPRTASPSRTRLHAGSGEKSKSRQEPKAETFAYMPALVSPVSVSLRWKVSGHDHARQAGTVSTAIHNDPRRPPCKASTNR
ncbi:hypothetical protein LHGZ1_1602 [Laribacter hongkongensis]|uniref:Uncharacterized protein n=1 Tax=Laribacter hongkongensis TaxID=168471 RepID=A0A248LJT1_9NEIS|nr:hypothetical protein LHGZ1_1602 [Laribacter hongkongensis]